MSSKYEDMLDLPHHQSDHRPHMSMHDRAAQFSPFAALTGHEAAIQEAGRLTEEFREPDENQKAMLDGKLQLLQENQAKAPEVVICCFVPDDWKKGGAYVEIRGRFRRVDQMTRSVLLEDGQKILLERIQDIQCDLFPDMD